MSIERSVVIPGLALVLSLPTAASAEPSVELHVVSDSYESCFFDLHPELTADEFKTFAAEVGQPLRSRQMASARTLGTGGVAVSMGYSYFLIDDTKGAWNNTMSHPDADHYLGNLQFPFLEVRAGITKKIDAEVYGSLNWMSNYGFFGMASKINLLDEADQMPVSVSVRPSAAALLGPSEMQAFNISGDLAVSRNFHGLSPFAGLTLSSTLAVNSSPDTNVGNQVAFRPVGFAGLEYRWKFINAAAQAEASALTAFALRVGGTF